MTPRRITIHCSASPNGVAVSNEAIEKWHLARGFKMIGYHWVIDVDGTIRQGRSINIQGAHVEGDNEDNVGICLVGDTKFSGNQFLSLKELCGRLCSIHKIPKYEIWTHAQFPSAMKQGKTCPNMNIQRLLAWLMNGDDKAVKDYVL